MPRSLRLTVGVAAVAASLLLSACAGPNGSPGESPGGGAPAELVRGADCLAPNLSSEPTFLGEPPTGNADHPDAPAPGEVPDDFAPVSVVRCAFVGGFEDEQGRWSAVTVETLTGDFGRLVTALAEPNDQPGINQACTLDMELVSVLWLQNSAGDAMRVAWPVTACGKTKPATHEVLATFEVTATETIPVTLLHSREALDAGCAMQASVPLAGGFGLVTLDPGQPLPMLPDGTNVDDANGAARVVPAQPAVPVEPAEGPGTVCFYDVDPAQDNGLDDIPGLEGRLLEGALTIVSGQFTGTSTLAVDAAESARTAASGSDVVAAECDLAPTRFAVIDPEPYGQAVTVELGGCGRLVAASGAAYVTPPDVAAALVEHSS